MTEEVFHTNVKPWSGDHCIDPSLVPGVLFCSRPIESDNPRLMDIGPTVLDLFGVAIPDYMDGVPLSVGDAVDGNGRPIQLVWMVNKIDGYKTRRTYPLRPHPACPDGE